MSEANGAPPMPTVLEAGTRFDGLVSFRGAVRVEGRIVGQVVADGLLWVGPQGELEGRALADDITVEGACDGVIEARHRIELRPSARVRGRLTAPLVVMADGCVFDGECAVMGPAASERRTFDVSRPEPEPLPAAVLASVPA